MTMAITTTCPNCKARFRLAEELAGKKVRCQKCEGIFEVPIFDGSMGTPTAPPTSSEPIEAPAAPVSAVTIAPPPMPVAVSAPPIEAAEQEAPRRDDYDDEPPPINTSGARRPPRLSQRAPAAKAGSGMTAVLLVIAGLAAFSCIICGGVGIAVLVTRSNRANPPLVNKQLPPINNPPQPQGPANPINVNLGPNGQFRHESQLTNLDPFNADGHRHKLYVVQLEANRTYQIDMMSNQIDSYLILFDDTGVIVDENDDIVQAKILDARLIYTPKRTGTYRIHATHCPPAQNLQFPTTGNYTLVIQRR
jgi:predicted Zn finger-like uncharacterized protein